MQNPVRMIMAAVLLLSGLSSAACSRGEAQASGPAPAAGSGRGGGLNVPVPVTVAPVVQKAVPRDLEAIGNVIAASTVAVHAQITGELTSVNFTEGDDVVEGQVLFTLDKRPYEAALLQAQAQLDKDVAQAANARAQSTRYQDLLKRGIATQEQVDQMTSQAAALDATVASDKAAIESARVQLDYCTIASPISGRTGLLQVHRGNLVRANDTQPIIVINRIQPVYVSFSIPEALLPDFKRYLAAGTVRVTAKAPNEQGGASTGQIDFVDNAVDNTTGMIKIKGTFPNADRRLWPGQFVNVTVTLTVDPAAIVVPTPAVQSGQQGNFVYVVTPAQTADLRSVTVARTRGNESIVATGLKPGETVITDGHLRLVPGSRITVKPATGPKATS